MTQKIGNMSNKILIIWTFLVVFILSTIYILGSYYLKNEEFIILKKEYKSEVKSYLKVNNFYPDNKMVVESKELINNGFIEEIKLKEKKCNAQAIVTKIFLFYFYDIDLKCK